jgi:hypothetical protein
MELEFAMLAEAANTLPDARLNILGGSLEAIYARNFPAIHPNMVVILRIKAHPSEMTGEHQVLIYLKDTDGKDIISGIQILIPPASSKIASGTKRFSANLIGQLANIHFPQKGSYSLEILIDGRHEKSLAIELVEIPQPKTAETTENQPLN